MDQDLGPEDTETEVDPLQPKASLRSWVDYGLALLVAATCLIPFAVRRSMDFKSDDAWLIGQGFDQSLGRGLIDAFAKPFLDTVLVDFYRPLYSYLYVVEASIFGANAAGYYFANMLWHGMAIALGFLLMRRVLPRGAALVGSLWFGLSPWCVNNVAWLVGACTTLCSVFIFASVLSYLRSEDRRRRLSRTGLSSWPWWAFLWAFVGVFFRETALFAPVLIALFDVYERRLCFRQYAQWVFLSLPFGVYLLGRYAVLGTLGGGYAKLVELWGPAAAPLGFWEQTSSYSQSALQLVAPGTGTFAADWSVLRIVGLALFTLILVAGFVGRRSRVGLLFLFGVFVVGHAIPLFYVDDFLHGGSSQRWHTVLWGIGALLAACVQRARWRVICCAGLIILMGWQATKTWQWLGNYEDSAAMTRKIREGIDAAPSDLVFVYNIIPYDQQSPNFEAGLGQLARRPFSTAGKRVYPIMYEQRYFEGNRRSQTPIAARLLAEGKPVTALWCDWENRSVDRIPDAYLSEALKQLSSLNRLVLEQPPGSFAEVHDDLQLEFATSGLARLDIHLITPVAEFLFSRYPHLSYAHGEFSDEGARYRENLGPMLRAVDFMAEQVDNRAWIWVVGYDRKDRVEGPVAVSDFVELKVVSK